MSVFFHNSIHILFTFTFTFFHKIFVLTTFIAVVSAQLESLPFFQQISEMFGGPQTPVAPEVPAESTETPDDIAEENRIRGHTNRD